MSLGDEERGAGQRVCALESSSICGVFGTVLPLSRSSSVFYSTSCWQAVYAASQTNSRCLNILHKGLDIIFLANI